MHTIETSGKSAAIHSAPVTPEMRDALLPFVDVMTKYNGAICDGYAAMGAEWLNFINRRLHIDLSLPVRLANCHTSQDVFKEWSAFLATAAEDYRREFARLAELNTAASLHSYVPPTGKSEPALGHQY
jgi:hypothetical protein